MASEIGHPCKKFRSLLLSANFTSLVVLKFLDIFVFSFALHLYSIHVCDLLRMENKIGSNDDAVEVEYRYET